MVPGRITTKLKVKTRYGMHDVRVFSKDEVIDFVERQTGMVWKP